MKNFKKIFLSVALSLCFSTTLCQAETISINNTAQAAPPKINLVWQADVSGQDANFDQLDKIPGVNVVSPCWFDIISANGDIRDKVKDSQYVTNLHDKGYQVWPLITNNFDPEQTHEILISPAAQDNICNNLHSLINEYQFDGLNLDFENIADEDKDLLTQFVQKITTSLKQPDFVISMDITTLSDIPYWSRCYDRRALGNTVDYVMLMAYDQHSPAFHVAGSTAALNWVEDGIKTTLEEIPAEKLLLGLPLYARHWETVPPNNYAVGKTIDMASMNDLIAEKNIAPEWQNDIGQYYLHYMENDKLHQVWQENSTSLVQKVQLVHKYQLAGIASWRKGFETPEVWPALATALAK